MVDPRFNGPPSSGNGGYVCGLVAGLVDAPVAEVTLRRPPPLGRPLDVRVEAARVQVLDDGELVAEAAPAELELDLPEPPTLEQAEAASARYPGFDEHAFPTCFVCGPARAPGDGLRIFPGPVAGRDLVAAPWTAPPDVAPEFVWASLDCPGAYALEETGRTNMLLGRLAARVERVPAPREPCVVAAWALRADGRKLYAGTALFAADGEPLARARATWILPR